MIFLHQCVRRFMTSRFAVWAASVLLYLLGIVALSLIAFRIEAILFARQVAAVTNGLAELKIGTSSKQEVFARLRGLQPHNISDDPYPFIAQCEECLSVAVPTPRVSVWLLTRMTTRGRTHPQ
jgi:hypothetical protein